MADDIVDLTRSHSPDFSQKPTPTALGSPLEGAIASAKPARICSTLRTICQYSPQARALAERILLVNTHSVQRHQIERDCDEEGVLIDEDEQDVGDESDDIDAHQKVPVQGGLKVLLHPRYATCINCEAEFDVTVNGEMDCRWHAGLQFTIFAIRPQL